MKPTVAWPSKSDTTRTCVPAVIIIEAKPCRRSCSRTPSSPQTATAARNALPNASGSTGRPSFVGEQFVVKAGERLRGSHPAVQTAPHLFLPDGAGDEEIAAARAQLLEREIEMSVAAAGPPPPPAPPRIDPSTRLADLVVCTQEVISSSVGRVREGTIAHKNDRRVIAAPEAFRPLLERI